MGPLVVATLAALLRRGRIARVTLEPVFDYVVVKLLGPQHAGKALTHDVLRIRRKVLGNNSGIELVGFVLAQSESLVEAGKRILAFEVGVGKAHPDFYCFSRTHCELVMSCCCGASMRRIDGILGAMHHIVVDAVFDVGSAVLDSKEPAGVGLVLGEQQFGRAFAMKPAITGRSLTLQTRV